MAEPVATPHQRLTPAWRPGDARADAASMLRVDQAGEYGATRIYAGQLAVLRPSSPAAKLGARMAGQEQRHLARFDALIAERRVRPTLLQPLWRLAGFGLGAATALMSERAAMACTDAVETEIDRHYADQLAELGDDDPELAADIAEFQAEARDQDDADGPPRKDGGVGFDPTIFLYDNIPGGVGLASLLRRSGPL